MPLVLLGLAASVVVALLRRALRRTPARAVIISPPKSTVIAQDGAVRSVQSAQLTLSQQDLERIWTAANLENLARTYWQFLSRVTLGLIRVVYTADSRAVVLLGRPLHPAALRAPGLHDRGRPPRGELADPGRAAGGAQRPRGSVIWRVDVRREPDQPDGQARLLIEVEVSNFYPSIAAGFSTPVYEMTQSAVHVLVTHAFLRSLAKLDLAKSKVGSLASRAPASTGMMRISRSG